jgi:uncharacterized protein (TIGR02453 family)
MTFAGIPLTALDFYEDLEDDNTKAFWAAHKQIYDSMVKAPIEAIAAALAPDFGQPKFFRPYRDVRFARDKTPYKTHQGVWFAETCTYFHVSAAGLFVAGGYWSTTSEQVGRLRRAVADDVAGAALVRTLAKVQRSGMAIGGDQITRVPSGYPKDHERADLLRYKSLTAHREFGAPAWLSTADVVPRISQALRSVAPLVSWLDTQVGQS